jgi:hypothetical protein
LPVQLTISTKNPVDSPKHISALVVIEIQGGFRQFVSIELRKSERKHTNNITSLVPDIIFEEAYKIPYALSQQRKLLSRKDGIAEPSIFLEPGFAWYKFSLIVREIETLLYCILTSQQFESADPYSIAVCIKVFV